MTAPWQRQTLREHVAMVMLQYLLHIYRWTVLTEDAVVCR